MNITDYIQESDLFGDIKELNELLGIETVRTLIKEIPQTRFYVPSALSFKNAVQRFLKDNEHLSKYELCVKLGCSENTLKSLKAKL